MARRMKDQATGEPKTTRRKAPPTGKASKATSKQTTASKAAKKKAAQSGTGARTRAPRQDYGYAADAKITVTGDKTYRGKRGEIHDILVKHNGKTVDKFLAAAQKKLSPEDPARGWLRFYVMDGAATLSGGSA